MSLIPDYAADIPSTMRRDILSAYALTGARVLSWVVVSAIVYRVLGRDAFAVVALIRGTIGILAYTSIGLAPALVRKLAEAKSNETPPRSLVADSAGGTPGILDYASPGPEERVFQTFVSGVFLAMLLAAVGLALAAAYGLNLPAIHSLPPGVDPGSAEALAFTFGVGMVLRLMGEAPGALLQVRHRIALDNLILGAGEITWAAIVGLLALWKSSFSLGDIGSAFVTASFLSLLARQYMSQRAIVRPQWWYRPRAAIMSALLSYGAMVMLAQSADFLYAPMDYILINRLLNPAVVADYAPAVQIDAGLLLLVTGVAAVLLPRTAIAHTSGDITRVRRYYITGTLLTTLVLALGAAGVWALSPLIFRLWLGNSMTATRMILPLVLVHTVVGGSSAVGRSVLLGMGKVKPFTVAVLIAGFTNVASSVFFAWYLGWGLNGIVLGTIVAVVGRCAIWMPWYILRTLRRGAGTQTGPAILPETTLG